MRKAGTTARHKCSLDCLWKETQHFCIWRAAKAAQLGHRNWVNAEITKFHLTNSWSKLKNTRGFFFYLFNFCPFHPLRMKGWVSQPTERKRRVRKRENPHVSRGGCWQPSCASSEAALSACCSPDRHLQLPRPPKNSLGSWDLQKTWSEHTLTKQNINK